MLVRATRLGFYNYERRRPGVVFEIDGDVVGGVYPPAYSSLWMEPAEKGDEPNEEMNQRDKQRNEILKKMRAEHDKSKKESVSLDVI